MKGQVRPELLEDYRAIRDVKLRIGEVQRSVTMRRLYRPEETVPNSEALTELKVAYAALEKALFEMREPID